MSQAAAQDESQAESPVKRLLIVDDDESVLRALRRTLRRSGWEVETATSGEEGLNLLAATEGVQVVVSDYKMPGMNGVEFLGAVKVRHPHAQRIMLTGYADQHAIEEAINRSEVFRFLSKPWDDTQLQLTIGSAFEQYALAEENRRLLRLTLKQNEALAQLATSLEEKVVERTRMLSLAKRDWERTFDVIDRPIAVLTRSEVVVRANLAFARMVERPIEEIAGRTCGELVQGDASRGCSLADATSAPIEREIHGRTYSVSAYTTAADDGEQLVAVFQDVTTERNLTRQIIQHEKLLAVGQLAGGVAHEINNPLGGILAFSQLMQRDPGRSPEDLESLRDIEHAALRCKRIVESLLKFSRRAPAGRLRVDVNRPVEDALTLFRSKLKEYDHAKLEVALAPELPPVLGDHGELEQVILNLLVNAVQALKDGAGTVRVSTELVDGQIRVRVEDDGSGIDPAHLPHIFEPTFTTKPPGEGTGFGLSIAWSIVASHGGQIEVDSEKGRGATFTVTLPPTTAA